MCKIKDLDRNKVYGLEEIKKDSVKFDMLKEWLKENDTHWCKDRLKELKDFGILYFNGREERWYHSSALYHKPTKCALTLFDLNITDYQVDCTELSDVEINNLEVNQGYKESDNKCNYELDFDFIKDIAMRIQNEPKYKPYNWQKPMNVEQLSNAMLRHAIEVKKGNFDDNGELGHILAIACNAMFIYHQKKHHND